MKKILTAALLTFAPTASAAALWGGVDVNTNSLGAHAGFALLPVPFIGTLGLEGGVERPWPAPGTPDTTDFSVAATLRDLNLPLTRTDAFVSAGVLLRESRVTPFAEAGLRFPVLLNAGLRVAARADTDGRLRAGAGLELRF
ncbi:hypothetical protein [Deinococcus maricopensis]|uniref:Outer membrane protein beta-barrel domain-containing protein n=1 Tax=Deinococcus maricopensis (strain DSM 21211 / LMG 22137 / NRRL B-23946 / LB-34) TaxID=709986 RepID=E8U9Z4_DEIML|nr:hypothetical protein [Deinococcus maricopensis]ADV67883.1 hypothetical protein Deima_2245 [Deinococcus maricopensis DSM 21211]